MLDAMSIRKHIDYSAATGEYIGYVDLGAGRDSTADAKEVLVFLLVGLCGSWKAPIAFFFTNGLTAETQKELVIACLERLSEDGFKVCALTLDGHATNVAMCRLLGADICPTSTQNFFLSANGSQKTHVFFDACHLIKLVRNTLHAYKTFSIDEQLISWQLIADLHETQEVVGLRLANKLSSKHISFQQQTRGPRGPWVAHLRKRSKVTV